MSWNRYLVLIVPAAQLDLANRIGRSLDPDVGGAESFTLDGNYAICGTACRDSFVATVQSLIDPNAPLASRAASLKALLDIDYAARWPDFEPPTQAECEVFLANVQVFVDVPWGEALSQAGIAVV